VKKKTEERDEGGGVLEKSILLRLLDHNITANPITLQIIMFSFFFNIFISIMLITDELIVLVFLFLLKL
jgi:hypothetical protein